MAAGDDKAFNRVAFGYWALSVVIAQFGPFVDFGDEWFSRFSSSTIEALVNHGGSRLDLSRYFALMTATFPAAVILMMWTYPKQVVVLVWKVQVAAMAIFLCMVLAFMAWIAYYLPPTFELKGRGGALIILAAKTDLGLGLLYGAVFYSMAFLVVFIATFLRDQLVTWDP